ncbi:ABC transporter permease [Arthrobacter sp. CAU 1506]|uniref:ABC transporter permease n=1 Tax=Arthrobacter sp. CAU 1506 TaxID=2560052 RepID=UPI00145C72C7|nr:ABC transporter permease [Arthrobacter sp. CAU 1506]
MNRLRSLAIGLPIPVILLGLWWVLSSNSSSPYWPPLSVIAQTFGETWFSERFETDLLPSLGRFAAGFAIAVLAGVGMGLACGLMPTVRRTVDPFIDFMRSLPQPALIPILIILLGIDTTMKIFIIALSSLWPILLNTIDGIRAVEPEKAAFAKIYGLSSGQWLTKVVLPAASPQIFVGARLALAIALIMMVVSEMVASSDGLGYFILISQQTFAIPEMWSGIAMLGIIGYLVNVLFVAMENRFLAWHRGWRAASLGAPAPMPAPRRRVAIPVRRRTSTEPPSFVQPSTPTNGAN